MEASRVHPGALVAPSHVTGYRAKYNRYTYPTHAGYPDGTRSGRGPPHASRDLELRDGHVLHRSRIISAVCRR